MSVASATPAPLPRRRIAGIRSDRARDIAAAVDAYAAASAAAAAADAQKTAARLLLDHLRGDDLVAHGMHHVVTVSTTTRQNVDTAAIRAEMGADWVAVRSKLTTVTSLRVTAL
jgi:hypothetical protein